MSKTTGRVTLTKAQAASAFGQRLIHQIMAMSHDGDIGIDEVRSLHALVRKGPADLNAATFLRQITTTILTDEHLDELEQYQLRKAMERVVPKDIRMRLAELLSGIGLPSTFDDDGTAWKSPNARWRGDPITAKQALFIRKLGCVPDEGLTKGEASALIDSLLQRRPPTPRQRMVLRFFDRCDLEGSTKEEVSVWLDALYTSDEALERAWHLYKAEVGDDGTLRDPRSVPVGEYRKYMRRRASGPAASRGAGSRYPADRKQRGILWCAGGVVVLVTLLGILIDIV